MPPSDKICKKCFREYTDNVGGFFTLRCLEQCPSDNNNHEKEIKDIVSPILATYGDTKLYYDILRTGRKLWISVYITMNRDMISISKFKSVQKEIIQALSKEYQDFYFELLPDIEYNGDTEVPEPVPDEEEA